MMQVSWWTEYDACIMINWIWYMYQDESDVCVIIKDTC